jgi:hypothetical protein
MPSPLFSVLFTILLAMVLVWFATVLWMFRRLRTRHLDVYEALGSPSLFWNNSPRNNVQFLKFIFSSRSRHLGDSTVANVVLFMRVFCVAYVAAFLLLIASFAAR